MRVKNDVEKGVPCLLFFSTDKLEKLMYNN
jgi:hypothetical protein